MKGLAGGWQNYVVDPGHKHISFPVGRVEYIYMKPLMFREFLRAQGQEESYEILDKIPIPEFAHEKLLKQFYTYTLIGGMPEVVASYVEKNDLGLICFVKNDDTEKYFLMSVLDEG